MWFLEFAVGPETGSLRSPLFSFLYVGIPYSFQLSVLFRPLHAPIPKSPLIYCIMCLNCILMYHVNVSQSYTVESRHDTLPFPHASPVLFKTQNFNRRQINTIIFLRKSVFRQIWTRCSPFPVVPNFLLEPPYQVVHPVALEILQSSLMQWLLSAFSSLCRWLFTACSSAFRSDFSHQVQKGAQDLTAYPPSKQTVGRKRPLITVVTQCR